MLLEESQSPAECLCSLSVTTAMAEGTELEDDQFSSMTTEDIIRASRLLDDEIRTIIVCKPKPRFDVFIFDHCSFEFRICFSFLFDLENVLVLGGRMRCGG